MFIIIVKKKLLDRLKNILYIFLVNKYVVKLPELIQNR